MPRPRLAVLVVVDQLRADFLLRLRSQMLPARTGDKVGGYRYLMERGAYFPHARHDVAHAMTAPGHATLSTGAYPHRTGIVLNKWYVAKTDSWTTSVLDPDSPPVGAQPGEGRGASPKLLLGPTLGDTLKTTSRTPRVVSVSLKARAAILMGGYTADRVLWFDGAGLAFVTSRYYAPGGALPPWVATLNTGLRKRRGQPYRWRTAGGKLLRSVKIGDSSALRLPYGVEITIDAALAALAGEHLGQREGASDLLLISLSSRDKLGHHVGPEDPLMAEMTLAEDRQLSRLFNGLSRHLPRGLDDVVIALSADHGVAPRADRLLRKRVPAGRHSGRELDRRAEAALVSALGKAPGGRWLAGSFSLNFYFTAAVRKKPDKLRRATRELVRFLAAQAGIRHVFSREDFLSGRLPPDPLRRQIRHSYFPGRSGDVVAIVEPFHYMADTPGHTNHHTGYSYDTTVPLLLAGPGIRRGMFPDPVESVDLAPTLSWVLGTIPPALAEGRVLERALVAAGTP